MPEQAWLIERCDVPLSLGESGNWVSPSDGIRFCRKEDALGCKALLMRLTDDRNVADSKVTEHEWCDGQQTLQSARR